MAAPKISIVVPSFNQAEFIEYTLRSIIDQNYDNLELIVIDGGSTDGSVDIIRKYLSQIAYFVSEPDSGHGNALNKGFQKSTGEIMAWLNSDDMYLPWTFRTIAEMFGEHPDIEWITGARSMWNDKGAMIATPPTYKNVFDYLAGKYEWLQQESMFWRRSLWEKAGGFINEDYKYMVDGELWSRFFLRGFLWNANCILSGYRLHKKNRAHQVGNECHSEMRKAIEAMRPKAEAIPLSAVRSDYPFLFYDFQKTCWVKHAFPRSPDGRPIVPKHLQA